jgi:group I intron endonuclease
MSLFHLKRIMTKIQQQNDRINIPGTKQELSIPGIYQIKNKINNKSYIGSSISIYKRLLVHTRFLNNNKHHSIHLQRAYNEAGKDNFEINILECVLDLNVLRERESYWIELLDTTNKEKGYNILKDTNAPNSLDIHSRLKRSDNTTGYKGVCWVKSKQMYKCELSFKGKTYFLGHYKTKRLAALKYDQVALYFYKEDANLNFPLLDTEALDPSLISEELSIRRRVKNKYTGVYYRKDLEGKNRMKKYEAKYKGKRIGYFATEKEAYIARTSYIQLNK